MNALDLIPRRDCLETLPLEQGSPEWLAERAKHIGGSEAAAAIGLSPWATPYDLWRRKRGLDLDTEATDLMDMGTALETLCVAKFARETGATIYRPVPYLIDRACPWRAVSLDGIATLPDGRAGVLECKYNSGAAWESIPTHYLVQGIHSCAVTGFRWVFYAEIGSRGKVKVHPVAITDTECESIEAGVDDFHRLVETGTLPEAQTDEDRERMALGRLSGRTLVPKMEAGAALQAIGSEIIEIDRAAKVGKARRDELISRLAEAMALAGVQKIECAEPKWSLTFVESKGRVSYEKACKGLGILPAQLEPYRGEPSRSVRFVGPKSGEEE